MWLRYSRERAVSNFADTNHPPWIIRTALRTRIVIADTMIKVIAEMSSFQRALTEYGKSGVANLQSDDVSDVTISRHWNKGKERDELCVLRRHN